MKIQNYAWFNGYLFPPPAPITHITLYKLLVRALAQADPRTRLTTIRIWGADMLDAGIRLNELHLVILIFIYHGPNPCYADITRC